MPDQGTPDRPAAACVLCPQPRDGRPWRLADAGYATCSVCDQRVRDTLKEIDKRYHALDPTPGASGDHGRGAPGFGSRSPANDHIISMTDRRSSPVARVWVAADGRVHRESERPPLSVWGVLDGAAWTIAEERGIDGPKPSAPVADLVRWTSDQLDWLSRRPLIVDVWRDLRALVAQLRPATGDKRAKVGRCPNVIDEGETTRECGAPLYAPTRGDTIFCGACGASWPRPEWERLGRILQEGAA